MLRPSIFVLIMLVVSCAAWAFQPAAPFKPGKLSPAEVAALKPGLTLRFYKDGKAIDARRVRLAALHVPAGEEPSPFVAPGPFSAKLSGYIRNPLKGPYSFRLAGTGAIVLRINDKVVLNHPDASLAKDKQAEVVLAKNYNRIEIEYTSPTNGDATMRLFWADEKYGFEPLSPDVLSSRDDDADLVAQTTLREGRQLFANRHCAACHGLPGNVAPADGKMPELKSTAPRLDDAGHRFHADWLAAWVLDPHKLRPEATMPRVLAGPDAEKQAADIAAYLAGQKSGVGPQSLGGTAKASEGESLFKKLGCVTCHRLTDPKEADELNRLSLFFVGAKFSANALAHFLKEPHKRYAWTRMPDFHLSDVEAGHLEAYLREQAKGKFDAQPMGDPLRGEKLFHTAGCASCHQIHPEKPIIAATGVKIKSLDHGCLGEKDRDKAPDFGLTPAQRAALTAFLKTDGIALTREAPAEFSLRQVKELQCASCHRRDGAVTRWHVVLEDEGKVPENLPSLTWTGEKLKPAWTAKMLAGTHEQRARPWLKARMPAFPARAEMLAAGLSHEHGFGVLEDDRPSADAALAAVGEKLIPQTGGFNCVQCHGIGKTPAKEPFEAPGINLLDAALRLRHGYYMRWMLEPSRVDATMRMPVFADGKMTKIREVFDGDAQRQFEALWQYIQTLPGKQKS